jgi:hypothetical protein
VPSGAYGPERGATTPITAAGADPHPRNEASSPAMMKRRAVMFFLGFFLEATFSFLIAAVKENRLVEGKSRNSGGHQGFLPPYLEE